MSRSIFFLTFTTTILILLQLSLNAPATAAAAAATAADKVTAPIPVTSPLTPPTTADKSRFVSDVNGVGASHICPNETWPQTDDPGYEELLKHAAQNIDDMEVDRGATQ